ncbi:MAG: hypothetical protein Q9224_001466 [Gallowayella concinna]
MVEALPKPGLLFGQSQTYGSIEHFPHTSSQNRRVFLQDLDNACLQPIDFYQPVFRRPMDRSSSSKHDQYLRITHPPVIELVDNATTWKGLASNDCETLLFIQGYLKICLDQLLQPQLIRLRASVADERRPMSRRSYTETDESEGFQCHRFQFDKAQLIQAVLEATDALTEFDGGQIETSSEELIILYLWSLGCFLDMPSMGSERTAIDVRFRWLRDRAAQSWSANEPRVMRMPDYITFEKLDVSPLEGTEIVIKPYYRANMSQQLGGPHLEVAYRIESNHPWLYWDSDAGAFKGRVPQFSQTPDLRSGLGQACRRYNQGSYALVHLLRIEVKAVAVLAYASSKVRLERTVRARVTLRASPPTSQLARSLSLMQSGTKCEDMAKGENWLAFEDGGCGQDIRSLDETAADEFEPTSVTPTTSHPSSIIYQSNTAGITDFSNLQPHSNPYRGELNRGSASHVPEDNEDSGRRVIQADKYDEAAEILDAQYSPHSPKKRNDACRWMDATVPPKACKKHTSSASMAKASPDLTDEELALGEETRAASLLDFLVKPGARKGKSSTIPQKPMLIRDDSDKENACSSIRKVKESCLVPAPKPSNKPDAGAGSRCRRLPLSDTAQLKSQSKSTSIKRIGNRQVDELDFSSHMSQSAPRLSKDTSLQAAEKSSPLPPLQFCNSFALLQELQSQTSAASSEDSSDSDHVFYWMDVCKSALRKVSQAESTTSDNSTNLVGSASAEKGAESEGDGSGD